MKTLKFYDKIIYIANTFIAFLLLLSYILPYIPPQRFAILSVLSLSVPLLIILNLLFGLYWLLKLKRQFLVSLIVLFFGFKYINTMYKLLSNEPIESTNDFSIMTYNIRLFNYYNWLPSKTIKADILKFISTEKPDILCVQEFRRDKTITIDNYSKYEFITDSSHYSGQAIFSKFPILNSGSVRFSNTGNNAIFIDVLVKKDTIRVYNLHLQSSGINSNIEALKKENSDVLFKKMSTTFKTQQAQAELFIKHKAKCNYKIIVAGDFNNTAYSYVYKTIKGKLRDAFYEAGDGFGRTYDFKFFPMRIDFILVDPSFTINSFKTYTNKLSDHFPIKVKLELNSSSMQIN